MLCYYKINRPFITIFVIGSVILIFSKCISNQGKSAVKKNVTYSDFAGSSTCRSCHANVYDQHVETAHHNSSKLGVGDVPLGSFEPGKNSFAFNPVGKVSMEKREDGYYQVEYLLGKEDRKSRFDITIGSGRKGQSYLSWRDSSLIQMPVTYFTRTARGQAVPASLHIR